MEPVYLNNAATSYPKPAAVLAKMTAWFNEPPVDSGRDLAPGGDPLAECREELAALLGVEHADRIALLPSATYALNLVLSALLVSPSHHVVTTQLEHNSVLRPLYHLAGSRGVPATYVKPNEEGVVDTRHVAAAMTASTALVAVVHASNVSGAVQPIEDIAGLAAEAGVPFLIDASQSAGLVPIDHSALPGRVFVAFAGHKSLLGPPGTGGLVLPDGDLTQTIVGGTGVRSESLRHPPELPFRHEAGTPNLPGLAGLAAGVSVVRETGVKAQGRHRDLLVREARRRLGSLAGVRLLPLPGDDGRAGIVSFVLDGHEPAETSYVLEVAFGIRTRGGLHCAPLAHAALGSAPSGTVRASFGPQNTTADVDRLVEAVGAILEHGPWRG